MQLPARGGCCDGQEGPLSGAASTQEVHIVFQKNGSLSLIAIVARCRSSSQVVIRRLKAVHESLNAQR